MEDTRFAPLEPNPGYGQVSLVDKLHLVMLLFSIPYTILVVFIRRYIQWRTNELSLKGDLVLSIARSTQYFLPLSFGRASGMGVVPNVLSSPRFSMHKEELFQRVSHKDFAGYWICSGTPGHHQEPSKCDIVLYHIHGGGYVAGHPGTGLPALLRIAEIAAERGVSIAVFALNYSLSPEAKSPIQIQQAIAGYKYLLHDVKVEPSKIAFYGDSAGAHLVLHLLAKLPLEHLSFPGAGVFLIAPWIDLWCSSKSSSYIRNKHRDYLIREPLVDGACKLFNSNEPKPEEPYTNFHKPLPDGLSWSDILPSRVWLSVGDHDLFYGDVIDFCDILRKSGVDVELSVAKGKVHAWEVIEDALDTNKYISTKQSTLPEGVMNGAARLAGAILAKTSS